MKKPTRPLVRYHGGKWMLAPWIISHFPEHRIYVEPSGGGGSVLLRKPRTYSEVYNDLDGRIVNLFRVARDRGPDLLEKLRLTPFAREEYAATWEWSNDPLELARQTLIRSFMGFGSNALCDGVKSGFRSDSNRSGTTPARDWMNLPTALETTIERLSGVVIEQKDALELIETHDTRETLTYCDPPYPHSTRTLYAGSGARRGYNHEMTDDDHRKFAEAVRNLKGTVIISGYACPLYDDELFTDWHRVEKRSLADGARKRTEVLWMNRQSEPTLFDALEAKAS